ncbi:mucoidy inhibitor MuiA family protein [Bradyrhizobium sp. U87765 SZCCT0131]|uniref:mucoidy inhibitor MuiA family protein n=1 Tax=unclassified Bradyrhizobium TaxID=2631580 RepID=UPI001BA87D40|nr:MULTISPECIES: mucoidy inhibitor MuiA family protein [unclassified Bradyrhizobium]MBR1219731.1 mucoidy inhibitor MuiA family protein [Bradyrhizobium sp. U87765 SZCCT0131]MBR1262382.1 mucoidy inhibitor MuiA family protein [Bradyrhizobium sp. U87765 SZCCT0134]MBR1308435.1 mucoidy inhibitor MuiA family protein [Bradyrhizobium sp. U87765 SZCCT0110]MBR1318164.1 mucoidy inhibitor MuiA family protein [Bradyrhizobium sp. U87765 SZCCT0109]MBR1351867.1 mucoidy inhibitor MuiA family protein [Bradyrhizo
MRITTFALLAAAPLAAGAAHAADIDAASKIDAVTVFPDGAMVSRLAELSLPEGASTVLIRGLPAVIDPASVRVEATADGELAIGAVETRLSPGETRPALDPALEAKITALKEEQDKVAARLDALEVKRKSIVRFSELDPTKIGKDERTLDPASWKTAWDTVGDELARVNEDSRVVRARRTELAEQITALEQARQTPAKPGAPKRDVTIAVSANGPLKAGLTLTYRVSHAAWTPRYDARLDTGGKGRPATLDLVRRAEITQRTGEDWDQATLSVSTVRTAGGTAAPEVTPLIVSFDDIVVPFGAGAAAERAAPRAPMSAAAPPPAPLADQKQLAARPVLATLEAGAFQANFKVPGRVSVPRDGSPKSFTLSTAHLTPELIARTSPALDPSAFLDVAFVQNEEAPLLPGEVNIHRDGVYVGKGRFPLVAPGDKATLGAGRDDRIKVTRVPLRQKDNEPGWINSSRTQVTEFKTTVKNLHDTPIRITVTDRLPVSDVNQISVEPLSTNTPATDKSVGDKRGVLAWSYDLAAGDARDIRLGWRLRWPGDRDIFMRTEPK